MASAIVGLMGLKGSGKDTFAARLVLEHGFTRLAFADALKMFALDVDPIVDAAGHSGMRLSEVIDVVGWDRAKNEYPEVRRLLQALGVAVREGIADDTWVDIVVRAALAIEGPVVVTDVRFRNEVEWIERAKGALVRVVRTDQVNTDTHVSETELLYRRANFVVRAAKGDVARLYREADFLARSMGIARHMRRTGTN